MTKIDLDTGKMTVRQSEMAKIFEWRDQTGRFHAIDKMETRHLFNTLRMIWNHSMPAEARDSNCKRYSFDAFYTMPYMADAICMMVPELLGREDLAEECKAQIYHWLVYLAVRRALKEMPTIEVTIEEIKPAKRGAHGKS